MEQLITVIVPVYNVERYLERCIESICNQTYQNMEIILINDGSTDESGLICEKWKNNDTRITLISTLNQGVSSARNRGLDIAKGEFISFVDSDDYLEPNMYEVLVNKIVKYNTDIVFCDYTKYDYGNLFVKSDMLIEQEMLLSPADVLNMRFNGIRNNIVVTVVWNKLYRAYLFKNIRFPTYKIHEDEFIICKLLFNASKVLFIPDRLYNYCENKNSLNAAAFKIEKIDRIEAMKQRLEDEHLINEVELKRKLIYEYLYNYIKTYKMLVLCKQYDKQYRLNIYRAMKQEFKKNIQTLNTPEQVKLYVRLLSIVRK